MLNRMGLNHSDMFGTPEWPVDALVSYLREHTTFNAPYNGHPFDEGKVWEPACGKGNIVHYLEQRGIDCYGSDISQGYDFLDMEVLNELYSCIITNPPFSLKDQFLKRCYELDVPFALLLPIQALSGIKRSKLFKDKGLQVLVLPKRVDFEYEDGTFKGKPWFSCAWFTHGFGLPKDLDWL
jgi:hypothetical protein